MALMEGFKKYRKFLFLILLSVFIIFCSSEKKDWEKAQSGFNRLKLYREFLKKHPNGKYADQAIREIEKMSFDKAVTENTLESYEEFLKNFPNGSFAKKARLKVEEFNFSKAEYESTIMAYQHFIRKFPEGDLAKIAQSRIVEFNQGIHPDWKDVQRVEVILKLSFPKGADLPIKEWIRRVLGRGGIELTEGDDIDPNATLTINSSGEALGDPYDQMGYLYYGAVVSGDISFSNHRGQTRRRAFSGRINPPLAIYGTKHTSTTPGSAPFKFALAKKGSFVQRLLEILQESFGTRILIYSLGDGYDGIRESAMAVLSRIKDRRKSGLLIAALTHNNPRVRYSAAKILGEIKDRSAVESLMRAIKDGDSFVRRYSVWALGRIRDPKAVGPLLSVLSALRNGPPSFKKEVIDALGEIGDHRAIEPLLKVLKGAQKDLGSYIRSAAADALQKITGQKYGDEYQDWADWWEKKKAR